VSLSAINTKWTDAHAQPPTSQSKLPIVDIYLAGSAPCVPSDAPTCAEAPPAELTVTPSVAECTKFIKRPTTLKDKLAMAKSQLADEKEKTSELKRMVLALEAALGESEAGKRPTEVAISCRYRSFRGGEV
jgi:hypothetical protein